MRRGALQSPCGGFRATLSREWAPGPVVCYIGHNPSAASHEVDDPTCLAWVHFAKVNGYGSYTAVNIYPFRSSDPRECRRWADYENNGPDWYARDRILDNIDLVARTAKKADIVVASWGNLPADEILVEKVIEEIQTGFAPYPDIYCLGTTLSGAPKHPMARGKHRIPRDQRFQLWRAAPGGPSQGEP